jgi:tetratricopeptide (TPR) repeat protein
MRFRFAPIIVLGLGLVLASCQNARKPDKETAQRNWSQARASVLYSLAQDQYKGHDFDTCKDTLGQAMKIAPDSAPLHTLAAKVDIEQGQLELAEKELEFSRKFGPNDPEAYYLSGVVYQRWQKPLTALEFYKQAGQRAPAELAYVLAQSEMLVALNRSPEALQLLQGKVAYFENSGTIRDAVGQLLVQAGRYPEAIDMFRQASILAEDNDSIRERLAFACYFDKQYRECAEVLARLLEKDTFAKRADLFALRGECQLNLSDPHGARRSFETATDLNPLSARYWKDLGRAALESGDYKRAEFALHRSVGIDDSVAETYLLSGYVRLKQAKYPEALAAFQRASTLEPGDTVSLCMVGYTYEKMGRHERAMACYSRAMKLQPSDDMARQLMAQVDKD